MALGASVTELIRKVNYRMKYGLTLPNFGEFSDVSALARLAALAEANGWDGFFIWDHIQFFGIEPTIDPWMALAVVAEQTQSMQLGALVTPLPRRNLAKLAREVMTLQRISNGRAVCGIGLGTVEAPEFTDFGDQSDPSVRGAMLDEGLPVLRELLSGAAVTHAGAHYQVHTDGFALLPPDASIPIWVAGTWPGTKPFRRAVHFDGVVPIPRDPFAGGSIEPEDVVQMRERLQQYASGPVPVGFDVVHFGSTDEIASAATVSAYAGAGVTWWVESAAPAARMEDVMQRVAHGPSATT